MMKASCQPGMVIGMGHQHQQHQQAGRAEARNGDKHGFRYFAQCTAPLTSRCRSGIWTLEICQPLKRPNFPTSIISHLPSNMYCGGPELFLNPGEDRLEDSYWSQDCVFCISSQNIPHFVFWNAYFLFCPECVFLWKRSEMIGSHQLENERTINNQRKESQLMFSISLNKAMLPMLKILPRIKQSWYTYWSVTDFTNSSPLFWRDTESQQFFCTEI